MLNRQLSGVRKKTLLETLGPVPDVDPDRYGDGGPVGALETRVAELLGTEAALFVPTGTMAQQIALKCWADRTHNPIVAMHPQAHPLHHEDDALTVLSGLRPIKVRNGPARAVARILRTGKRSVVIQVDIYRGDDDELGATATVNFAAVG